MDFINNSKSGYQDVINKLSLSQNPFFAIELDGFEMFRIFKLHIHSQLLGNNTGDLIDSVQDIQLFGKHYIDKNIKNTYDANLISSLIDNFYSKLFVDSNNQDKFIDDSIKFQINFQGSIQKYKLCFSVHKFAINETYNQILLVGEFIPEQQFTTPRSTISLQDIEISGQESEMYKGVFYQKKTKNNQFTTVGYKYIAN